LHFFNLLLAFYHKIFQSQYLCDTLFTSQNLFLFCVFLSFRSLITLERKVAAMQQSNDKKLNEIKQTVDEKLTRTLNDRFKKSFKFLSKKESIFKRLFKSLQLKIRL